METQAGIAQRRALLAPAKQPADKSAINAAAAASSTHSISGQREGHRQFRRSFMLSLQTKTTTCAPTRARPGLRSSWRAAALLAQVRKAQDRVDQIVLGRQLERVDAGMRARPSKQRSSSRFPARRRRGKTLPEAAIVRVDEESARRFLHRCIVTSSPMSGSSISSGSYKSNGHHLVAACAKWASAFGPARRTLMKSEMTKTTELLRRMTMLKRCHAAVRRRFGRPAALLRGVRSRLHAVHACCIT